MAIEIERRFLVRYPVRAIATDRIIDRVQIRQGYFGRVHGLKLRIRIILDDQGRRSAVLTRKTPRLGYCRKEYEQPMELDAAEQALRTLPATHIIHKRRHRIANDDGFIWLMDCFEGQNAGLVIAEIELTHPEQSFKLPGWVGPEITMDPHYGNSALARSPISIRGPAAAAGGPRQQIVGLQ